MELADRDDDAERRDQASDEQDHAADLRDEGGARQDRAADLRDEASAQGDLAADLRDVVSDRRDQTADRDGAATELAERAAALRALAALDRRCAADDRSRAGKSRLGARFDRRASAGERRFAKIDRVRAASDRAQSAEDRTHASTDVARGRERRRLRGLRSKLDSIIAEQALRIAFQPIIAAVSGAQVGVEALARFTDTSKTPEQWFAAAESVGRGPDLQLLAVRLALQKARTLPDGQYLAVNVAPEVLIGEPLSALLLDSGFPSRRLVIELTEHASITDYQPVLQARTRLAAQGMRLAIDDAGAGFSSFRHIVALGPDIIKIDRSLVSGVDHTPARSAFIAAIVTFAGHTNATTVAEGVVTAAERQQLIDLGVDHIQGYLTGAPKVTPD